MPRLKCQRQVSQLCLFILSLQKQVQTRDEEINGLQEELRNLQLELDSSKGQLLLTKDTVQKLSQDKGSIAQGEWDYFSIYILPRKLN